MRCSFPTAYYGKYQKLSANCHTYIFSKIACNIFHMYATIVGWPNVLSWLFFYKVMKMSWFSLFFIVKLIGLQVHQKWTKYFEKAKSIACYSELLKISQFVFALSSHNANVERVFSLMQIQWTKERNQLSVDHWKGLYLCNTTPKTLLAKIFMLIC